MHDSCGPITDCSAGGGYNSVAVILTLLSGSLELLSQTQKAGSWSHLALPAIDSSREIGPGRCQSGSVFAENSIIILQLAGGGGGGVVTNLFHVTPSPAPPSQFPRRSDSLGWVRSYKERRREPFITVYSLFWIKTESINFYKKCWKASGCD